MLGILTVLPKTVITQQPTNVTLTVKAATSVSFNVLAPGSQPFLPRQKNGLDLTDIGRFSGTGTDNLVITDVRLLDAGVYTCVVGGDCGNVTSAPVTLSVEEDVNITVQPVSKSICPGNNTSFSVSATGSNLAYEWQHNNTDIAGATTRHLSFPLLIQQMQAITDAL